MKRLIAALLAVAAVMFGIAWLPVFADTPGVSSTCFPQTMNPHPTAPAGQTTDTLFCSSQAGNGATTTAGGAKSGSGQTVTTSGAGAGSKAGSAKSSPASGGFFGGLVAFLGAAGGLAILFSFLLLLAIGLFIVAVVLWLTRRGGISLGSRFARIAHRP